MSRPGYSFTFTGWIGDAAEVAHCLALGSRRVARHVPGAAPRTLVERHGD
ncbi:MAG: hypothetical protein ACYCV4_04520 [Dermatophilaceae bacterium]